MDKKKEEEDGSDPSIENTSAKVRKKKRDDDEDFEPNVKKRTKVTLKKKNSQPKSKPKTKTREIKNGKGNGKTSLIQPLPPKKKAPTLIINNTVASSSKASLEVSDADSDDDEESEVVEDQHYKMFEVINGIILNNSTNGSSLNGKYNGHDRKDSTLDDHDDEEEDEDETSASIRDLVIEEFIYEKKEFSGFKKEDNSDVVLIDQLLYGINTNVNLYPNSKRHTLPSVWASIFDDCQKIDNFTNLQEDMQKDLAFEIFEKKLFQSNPGLIHISAWRTFKKTYELRRELTPGEIRLLLSMSNPNTYNSHSSPSSSKENLTPQEIGILSEEQMRLQVEKNYGCTIFKPSGSYTTDDGLFVGKIDGLLLINGEVKLWEAKNIKQFNKSKSIREAISSLTETRKMSCCVHLKDDQLVLNPEHIYGNQILLYLYMLKLDKCILTFALDGFRFQDQSTHHLIESIEIVVDPNVLKQWYFKQTLIVNSIIKNVVLSKLYLNHVTFEGKLTSNGPNIFCNSCEVNIPPQNWNVHALEFHVICKLCPENNNRFSGIHDLNIHLVKAHDEPKKFRCKFCDFINLFSTYQHLKYHQNHAHKSFYQCKKCKKIFNSFSLSRKHYAIEHSNNPHKCLNPECNQFNKKVTKSKLISHIQGANEKYKICHDYWVAAGNSPVRGKSIPGGRQLGKKDEAGGQWLCVKECQESPPRNRNIKTNKKLYAKATFKIHIGGSKNLQFCHHHLLWRMANKDKQWNGSAWKCVCGELFALYYKEDILSHQRECTQFISSSDNKEDSPSTMNHPTFSYTQDVKTYGKLKKKLLEENEEETQEEN